MSPKRERNRKKVQGKSSAGSTHFPSAHRNASSTSVVYVCTVEPSRDMIEMQPKVSEVLLI